MELIMQVFVTRIYNCPTSLRRISLFLERSHHYNFSSHQKHIWDYHRNDNKHGKPGSAPTALEGNEKFVNHRLDLIRSLIKRSKLMLLVLIGLRSLISSHGFIALRARDVASVDWMIPHGES